MGGDGTSIDDEDETHTPTASTTDSDHSDQHARPDTPQTQYAIPMVSPSSVESAASVETVRPTINTATTPANTNGDNSFSPPIGHGY